MLPQVVKNAYPRGSRMPWTEDALCGDVTTYLDATRMEKTELKNLVMEKTGFKLIDRVWQYNNPLFTHGGGTYGAEYVSPYQCQTVMWEELRQNLVAKGPSCWQKIGYYGQCEGKEYGQCDGDPGCQWNPPIDVVLLSEVTPHGMDKETMVSHRNPIYTELQDHRRRSHGEEWNRPTITSTKETIYYRRSGLNRDEQEIFWKASRKSGGPGQPNSSRSSRDGGFGGSTSDQHRYDGGRDSRDGGFGGSTSDQHRYDEGRDSRDGGFGGSTSDQHRYDEGRDSRDGGFGGSTSD
eukprot:g5920.t1